MYRFAEGRSRRLIMKFLNKKNRLQDYSYIISYHWNVQSARRKRLLTNDHQCYCTLIAARNIYLFFSKLIMKNSCWKFFRSPIRRILESTPTGNLHAEPAAHVPAAGGARVLLRDARASGGVLPGYHREECAANASVCLFPGVWWMVPIWSLHTTHVSFTLIPMCQY